MPGSGRSTCSGDCTEPQKETRTRDIPCLTNTTFAMTMSNFLYLVLCCCCAKFHFPKNFGLLINMEHPSLIGMYSCNISSIMLTLA